ncbi:MAG: M67 family metallopeptidase [Saprospiraceae bacterium]|nr:M67 family metallopeptidase [Saprospiraceae bacterium]MBP7679859.1 M67 family metallopeptidase [Saprospiraceae bacterium]
MNKLVIEPSAVADIFDDGIEAFPNECCGFLYGDETAERRIITIAQPVINKKEGDQRRRFQIAPLDYIRAEQFAIANNVQLLGVYHSHPLHPAIASEHDLEKAMPYFSYIIISVFENEVRDIKSWRLYDDKREFYEEQVQCIAPQTI